MPSRAAKAASKEVERALSTGRRSGAPANLLDFDVKGIFVSIHQFCQETGKDRASIDKKLRLGFVKPIKGASGNAVYRLRDLIELAFYRDDSGRVDIDRMDPFRRKAHYSAELDKLKMQRESGLLIPVSHVEAEQARIAKIVTQFLDTLPDILERDCGAGAAMLAKVEQRLDAVREDLYRNVKGDEDEGEPLDARGDRATVGDSEHLPHAVRGADADEPRSTGKRPAAKRKRTAGRVHKGT